jgi:hypothetical protein
MAMVAIIFLPALIPILESPIHTELPLIKSCRYSPPLISGEMISGVLHFAAIDQYGRSEATEKKAAVDIPAKFVVKRVCPTRIRRAGGFEWHFP